MNKKTIDQIFEEACIGLGISMTLPDVSLLPERNQKAIIAFYKLSVIIQWRNEGWEPNWNDANEWKYYPWFYLKSDAAGLGFSITYYTASDADAYFGSQLCFKSRQLAIESANDLMPLYEDMFLIKSEEVK
ncbi:MAG: hypothetical protein AB9922_07325 [Bacteroidales bacterium]